MFSIIQNFRVRAREPRSRHAAAALKDFVSLGTVRPLVLVHTDMCILYYGFKPILPEMIDHMDGFDIIIPLCASFLCFAAALLDKLVTSLIKQLSMQYLGYFCIAFNYCRDYCQVL